MLEQTQGPWIGCAADAMGPVMDPMVCPRRSPSTAPGLPDGLQLEHDLDASTHMITDTSLVSLKDIYCCCSSSLPSALYGSTSQSPYPTCEACEMSLTATASLTGFPFPPCSSCGFGGYDQDGHRLVKRSRSAEFEDLPLLSYDQKIQWGWTPPPFLRAGLPLKKPRRDRYPAGQSPLERLPPELLDIVLEAVSEERTTDLVSCLLSSRSLHSSSLPILYKKVTFLSSLPFSRFLGVLEIQPAVRTLVERLDFSRFTSVGLGRSQRASSQAQMLTSSTLTRCLELLPGLREFLAQQHLDSDIDGPVLRQLLCHSPHLEVLDLCAASSATFLTAIASVIQDDDPDLPDVLPLKRLGLHDCINLPPHVFRILLPRLTQLRRLDVAHTTIDNIALNSLPASARLTHLNVGRCARLAGNEMMDFLCYHPAVASLVELKIPAEHSGISPEGLHTLLPRLPTTLRSLTLSGNSVDKTHLPHLSRLIEHLEELSVANTSLRLPDLMTLFKIESSSCEWGDAIVPARPSISTPVRYLDIAGIVGLTSVQLCSPQGSLLASQNGLSLEVIEIDENVSKSLKRRHTEGWITHEIGRRNFLVRCDPSWKPSEKQTMVDRLARRWGNRKMAMSDAKVGGMYAHYASGVR